MTVQRFPGPRTGASAGTAPSDAVVAALPALLDLTGPAYVADAEGRLLFANAAFDAWIRPGWAASDDRLPAELRRRIARAGTPLRHGERVDDAGTLRIFDGRHSCVFEDGAPRFFVGSYQEVTRAEEALARVRAVRGRFDEMMSTVSDWVWEVDADWRFVSSSTRGEGALGRDPTYLLGRDFFDVGELIDNPRAPGRRPLTRRRRAPFERVLMRLQPPHRGPRLFELSAIPKFDDASGRFAGFAGSARDVTAEIAADRRAQAYRAELEATLAELRRKNAELDTALERALAADHAKNEFLAMVGHELRTPLNAVIGFSEVMEGQLFGPLGHERYDAYVGDILASSRHLLELINDIIDVVKLELHEVELAREEVEVRPLLDTCLSFLREKAVQSGLTLSVDAAPDLPPLLGDPRKLRQMLLNLLSNAVKFTEAGGEVTLSAAWRAAEGHRLAVSDTGAGIAAEDQERILHPFRQADGSLTRQHDGLGLGLPLTKKLAEAHGGRLELVSAPGRGTTVRLLFPPDAAAASRPSGAARPSGSDGGP